MISCHWRITICQMFQGLSIIKNSSNVKIDQVINSHYVSKIFKLFIKFALKIINKYHSKIKVIGQDRGIMSLYH